MSFSTLLDVVNQAEAELGLPASTTLAAATLGQPRQMFALANACGRRLLREHTWGGLQTQGTIVTVSGQSTYSTPSDYSRMLPETQWDTSTKWAIAGPITPQLYRALVEGPYGWPSGRVLFRQVGFNSIAIYPTPTSNGLTYDFAYISSKWALSSGSVAQTAFLADTDTSVFDPDLFVADLKWRFHAAKGTAFAAPLRIERDELLALVIAADLGGKTLDMGEERSGDSFSAIGSSIAGNILVTIGSDG